MEEADSLCDRIAIMKHGQIECCGSPLFLKNYYSDGFKIKVIKNKQFNSYDFDHALKKHLNRFSIESDAASEIVFNCPFENSQLLPDFFNDLEINKTLYGLDSFSMSSASMEQVFLRINKNDEASASKTKIYFDSRDSNGKLFSYYYCYK
jgi:ATP-binding cassette subfamily A (ABC1) protein 3